MCPQLSHWQYDPVSVRIVGFTSRLPHLGQTKHGCSSLGMPVEMCKGLAADPRCFYAIQIGRKRVGAALSA